MWRLPIRCRLLTKRLWSPRKSGRSSREHPPSPNWSINRSINPSSSSSLYFLRRRCDQKIVAAQPVEAIKRGGLVAFRQRGIVEHGIHKVVDVAVVGEHGLTDVNQFAGALADDVDAQ